MEQNFIRKLIFDEKTRALLIQTLVIGIFAVLIYLVTKQTAYNLEKRGIGTGFVFPLFCSPLEGLPPSPSVKNA